MRASLLQAAAAAAAAAAATSSSSSAAGLQQQQQLGDSMAAAAASGGLGSLDEQLAKRTLRPAAAGAGKAGGGDAWDDNGVLGEDLLPM